MNLRLNGGCQVPIAAYATLDETSESLHLRGLVGEPDGSRILRAEAGGSAADAEKLGQQVAEALLAQGAADILERVYSA